MLTTDRDMQALLLHALKLGQVDGLLPHLSQGRVKLLHKIAKLALGVRHLAQVRVDIADLRVQVVDLALARDLDTALAFAGVQDILHLGAQVL